MDEDILSGLVTFILVYITTSNYFRPMYVGQASKPILTPKMDSLLWAFVKSKGMDEKMFRALVRLAYYLRIF
jgi:hypothetical protein